MEPAANRFHANFSPLPLEITRFRAILTEIDFGFLELYCARRSAIHLRGAKKISICSEGHCNKVRSAAIIGAVPPVF